MGEMQTSEFKLSNAPSDAISTVRFSPVNFEILGASSWDTFVRLYNVQNGQIRHQFSHNGRPTLDFAFKNDGNYIFSGGLDGQVLAYDLTHENVIYIGAHTDGVRCVEYSSEKDVIISGSWDSNVKVFDLRCQGPIIKHFHEKEIYSMNVKDEMLVVATNGRKIYVWDMRKMNVPLQERDSLLKYQTRCVKIFPNKQGFILSSIEGRVAVEYFDPCPEIQKKKYAFKCHRIKEQGIENIYPVNAISFHEEHHTFATGGSDGFVNVWDGFNKKRLCQFHRYPTSVSSLAFSGCGTMLAIACSYLYEMEETPNPLPENCIFIRPVTDTETKEIKS